MVLDVHTVSVVVTPSKQLNPILAGKSLVFSTSRASYFTNDCCDVH